MKGIIEKAISMFKGDINAIKAYLRLKRINASSELLEKRIHRNDKNPR